MLLVMGHSFFIFDHSIGKRYYLKCGRAQIWVWHSCSEYLVFAWREENFTALISTLGALEHV